MAPTATRRSYASLLEMTAALTSAAADVLEQAQSNLAEADVNGHANKSSVDSDESDISGVNMDGHSNGGEMDGLNGHYQAERGQQRSTYLDLIDPESQGARHTLIEACHRLLAAAQTPREVLIELSFQHCATATLQMIVGWGMAHAIPLDGGSTYAAIADSLNSRGSSVLPTMQGFGRGVVPAALVQRLVQHAMSFGVFAPAPLAAKGHRQQQVVHNPASALLVTDPDLEAWLYLCTNVAYPAGARLPTAFKEYGASSEPNETAYSVSIGRRISQFERFREADGQAEYEMFAKAMKGIAVGGAYDIRHVVEGGYWDELHRDGPGSLIVDVGGGPGHVSVALARKYPDFRFEVQDLPETVAFGASTCAEEVKDRINFRAHDFFKPQPIHARQDAPPIIYFARFILHDWSDKYAVKIIGALAQGMRSQDRLILNEVLVPEPGEAARAVERKCHDRDLLMLMNLNGRERTLDAFKDMFQAVTPRLCISRVHRPPQGELSLIEAMVDLNS